MGKLETCSWEMYRKILVNNVAVQCSFIIFFVGHIFAVVWAKCCQRKFPERWRCFHPRFCLCKNDFGQETLRTCQETLCFLVDCQHSFRALLPTQHTQRVADECKRVNGQNNIAPSKTTKRRQLKESVLQLTAGTFVG